MYVRWQSRKLNKNTRWREAGDVHWRAFLVENVRVDGKPTQRHIAYLGGITERNIAHEKPAHRIYFWSGVEQKLAVLNFSAKERTAIMQVIAKKVPRVTSGQYQQHARVSAKTTVSHRGSVRNNLVSSPGWP
jgi:hypothetical protein